MPKVRVTIPSKDKHISAMVKGLAFSVPANRAHKSQAVRGVTDKFLQLYGYLEFDFVLPSDAKAFKALLRWNLAGRVASP